MSNESGDLCIDRVAGPVVEIFTVSRAVFSTPMALSASSVDVPETSDLYDDDAV